jgi:hypothetical protein
MDISELAPWRDMRGTDSFCRSEAWLKFTSLVTRTLENDPRRFPHQIRAAAAMVILFCRNGLWPSRRGQDELEEVLSLARRQLSQIRQLYAAEARVNPEISGNKDFRDLLKSLDEEMRCLDARASEDPLNLPNEPPLTWGKFFQ